jgi:thiamine-monophosphate kinase
VSLENDLLDWLHEHLPTDSRLTVGLGDDAAVLAGRHLNNPVVTTDMITEGVDFLLSEVDPVWVGHKELGVNLSDLAAMAARPVAAFVSLVLPREGFEQLSSLQLAIQLYEGMLPLAERFQVSLAGGDTNTWEGPLAISITVLGETTPQGPLTRSGAQAGDQIFASGQFGGSILGKHLHVEPRIHEALLLHERYTLHAGIDVSDGLALDISRLAEASACGALIDTTSIPISAAACKLSKKDSHSALQHAMGDGEDFELVIAVPPATAEKLCADEPLDIRLTRIGEMIETRGLWQANLDGTRQILPPYGYLH